MEQKHLSCFCESKRHKPTQVSQITVLDLWTVEKPCYSNWFRMDIQPLIAADFPKLSSGASSSRSWDDQATNFPTVWKDRESWKKCWTSFFALANGARRIGPNQPNQAVGGLSMFLNQGSRWLWLNQTNWAGDINSWTVISKFKRKSPLGSRYLMITHDGEYWDVYDHQWINNNRHTIIYKYKNWIHKIKK